jgi:hypothetical protein
LNLVRKRFAVIGLAALGLAVFAAACSSDDEPSYNKIFQAPPWTAAEMSAYNLMDRGGHVYGTCTLETKPDFQPGKTQLNRLCGNGPNRDDGSVTVAAKTLRPIESSRTIADSKGNKRTVFSASYGEKTVKLTADDNGKTRETSRDLPQPNATSPDPGYYDDDSLLWLARGLRLEKGFEGAYRNITSGNAQVITVRVKVDGQERVKVPAGEFATWNIRIDTNSITQRIWVDVEAPHRVVKARFEDLTYELTESK